MSYLDDNERIIGEAYKGVFRATLSSFGLHPLINTFGLSLNEAQVLIANARHELEDLSYRPYLGLYVLPSFLPSFYRMKYIFILGCLI